MAIQKNFIKNFFADFTEVLIIGVAVFALAWVFLAEPLEVTGDSMEPTLHNKEQILVEKVSMNFDELQRGDIIVFNSPENPKILVIKRIIGIPGDIVVIEDNAVILNGQQLKELYLKEGTITEAKNTLEEGVKTQVPFNSYIVLGDNRTNSTDSRDFGPIKEEEIVGKAIMVYYPFSNNRMIKN